MPTISGTVYDDGGAAVAGRVVRAYRRDTGALLAETQSGDGGVGDPNYSNVSLLLHMDGVNGSTTFTDKSQTPKTVTVNGNVQISTAYSVAGGYSAYFDGSGDSLTVASHSAFGFGSGDWSIETFVRRQNADVAIFDLRSSGSDTSALVGYISASGYLSWFDSSAKISATNQIPANEFMHVAYCKQGGTLRMFAGGVLVRSDSKGDMGASSPLRIGMDVVGGAVFMGHMGPIRVKKGEALYTGNFTPPSAPFPSSSTSLPPGGYEITTSYTGECNVVCLDDSGGTTHNDLILRTTPV